MINCILGTRAQLIKMAPVINEIEDRGLPFNLIFTGQHIETMPELVDDFGIRTRIRYLYTGNEITSIRKTLGWLATCLWRVIRDPDKYIQIDDKDDIVVIHGDTLSTLLGALVGKLRKIKVAHVESGLRSFNVFHPFPEEIIRIVVTYLSDVAFCPGKWASNNLKNCRSLVIDTKQNTLIDALDYALRRISTTKEDDKIQDYVVCSVHRFENIFSKESLGKILLIIEEVTLEYKLYFVVHPTTYKKLIQFNYIDRLNNNKNITLVPRMRYTEFIKMVYRARFVITDGGSNQEELYYLNIPTLILRKTTERKEGIDSTAYIGYYNIDKARQFLKNIKTGERVTKPMDSEKPSARIVDNLCNVKT